MGSRTIRVVDLFAGAGGLTTGFHTASSRFRSVAAVEIDPYAAASYEATFGKNSVFSGSLLDWLAQGDMPRNVDIVVGGPPCQGFSTLGKQDVEDARNHLREQYAATLIAVEPRYFVVENVPAFGKSPSTGTTRPPPRPGGPRVPRAHARPSRDRRADPLQDGARRPARRAPVPDMDECFTQVRTPVGPRQVPGSFSRRELHISRDYSDISLKRFATILAGGNRSDLPDDLKAPCWRRHTTGSMDVMGRLHWDRPSVTIRTEFFKPEKGRYLHPVENRAITHYEAALLQGFPEEHRFIGSAIARQIGNAVPIPLGTAIARQILKEL
ncbi:MULTISPECIES: DNA cytosine methyltransferase [Actinomyces]|uniref:DNA cytosine methyltransferase n=1 Tax=Actinomyces TaxID=1654 RepID=UPI001423FCB0|nr:MULTISPECIES: DNA cytosine methyltransferase [Actinomyces]